MKYLWRAPAAKFRIEFHTEIVSIWQFMWRVPRQMPRAAIASYSTLAIYKTPKASAHSEWCVLAHNTLPSTTKYYAYNTVASENIPYPQVLSQMHVLCHDGFVKGIPVQGSQMDEWRLESGFFSMFEFTVCVQIKMQCLGEMAPKHNDSAILSGRKCYNVPNSNNVQLLACNNSRHVHWTPTCLCACSRIVNPIHFWVIRSTGSLDTMERYKALPEQWTRHTESTDNRVTKSQFLAIKIIQARTSAKTKTLTSQKERYLIS